MSPRNDRLAALERRLVEVESQSAFQERVISQLDGVVREFTQRVQRLEDEVARLKEQVLHGGGEGDDDPAVQHRVPTSG